MKTFKISTIIIAVIAIFSSCKKENITKQRDVKDFTSTNMKMNYYGKILEYTIKYSPSTNQVKVEGKDAGQFNEITKKYKNPVALYTSENEITFYNTTDEYYAYVFRNMINKTNARVGNDQTSNSVHNQQTVTTTLFEHINYSSLLRTSSFDNWNLGTYFSQSFTVYQKCGNDNTDNWCPTNYTVSTKGVKETWISDRDNDKYSSFKVIDQSSLIDDGGYPFPNESFNQYNFMQIVFFQDANYGGKAIGWNKPINSAIKIEVSDLRTKKINAFGNTWNDRISSFYQFFSI
jgi:hypothetical protein